nr:transcription factor TFIIIB component B'' homolog isoform X1 [Pogona vitticeps]
MFRRSRFSVKPNVRPNAAGRGGSGSAVPPPARDVDGPQGSAPTTCSSAAAGGSAVQPGEAAALGDVQPGGDDRDHSRSEKTSDASSEQDGSKHSETLLQRRKRISTLPNLAKPRVTLPPVQHPVNLASKCPPKQVSHSSTFGSSPLQKESPSSEKVNVEISPKSPVLPEKKTPVPQVPQFSPFKKSTSKEPNVHATTHRSDEALEKSTFTPLKERPTQEKTLQEEVKSQTQSKLTPVREKKICSDREKIIKTKKLRKMLKEELKKEKEQRKYKSPVIEKNMPEDRSKMIMRDFIYYLPENNPMKSSLVEEKRKEKTSTVTQAKEPEERIVADHVDENEEDDEEDEGEDDGPLLVPRVKVAEDGSIILDEESLTVEVLRTKGQCVVEENDPIFERGSTTTYSSFRRSYYTKPWSEKETEMFFLAISMVGTDFSMISQLFPHRARTEIKNKFKREEKANGWRIDKAFKEKRPFDFNFFTKLLEKVLENERRRKEKDAKCQHQREKLLNEKKTSKSQKHQQEMEVDVGTAEKENEESPSILEQAEGPTVPESVVTKKKKKRKKKDSEHEMESLPEETTVHAEMAEGKRSRKKRKNISAPETNSINEADEELDVPGRVTPDETLPLAEEDPQCYTLDEEAEGDDASSVHESGEVCALEAVSGHHTEQPSESPDPNKEVIEGISATKSVAAELDKLDENQTTASPHCEDEIRETDITITEKPRVEEQQQIITSDLKGADLTRAEEEGELLVGNLSEVKISPFESMSFEEKSTAENNTADITGPIIEETCRTNKDMENESQETENAPVEKIDVRSRRQRPKPNIMKASCRKEAHVQSKLNTPEPCASEQKNTAQEEIHSISAGCASEKDSHLADTELLTAKKTAVQESGKQTILKPASLARGRMQRPKPNLGRLVRRQGGSAKNTETEEAKTTEAAVEAEMTQTHPKCGSSELLSKNVTEAHTYEVDMASSEELENMTVASAVQESPVHMSQSPVTKPLECESPKLQTASLSSSILGDVADLSTRDFSLQQEEKEFLAETEESLKSYSPSLSRNLGKEVEEGDPLQIGKEVLGNKHESEMAEESLVNISRKCSKSSNLDEEANCRIVPSMDNQEAVTTSKLLLSPPNSLECKNSEQNEVLVSSDIQKNISVGEENSQGVSKQSVVRPPLLLRSRFQKPRPNIGRAVGRKEVQSVEGNEATGAVTAGEKSEIQKPEPFGTLAVVAKPPQILPAEALENKSADNEKKIPEDSQVPSTSPSISDQCLREKPILQEGKLSVIKPAQLVRGRFQRARPSLGRIPGKKEETVPENINASVEKEVGKQSVEIFKRGDLEPPSKEEVIVQASLDNVEKKDGSESNEGTLPKICIDQKKLSSSENSQGCVLLIHEEEEYASNNDDEGKHLDIPESDISATKEISQLKSTKPVEPTRSHFQKPKPSVTPTSKKNEAVPSEDISTQGMAGRDTEKDATPCSSASGNMSPLIDISQNSVESASIVKSLKQKACADSTEAVSVKRSRHSGRPDFSEQSSENESEIQKEISKPLSVQERRLKGKQPERTQKQKKNSGDSKMFCASECESDLSRKGKHYQKSKANVSRGKSLKPALRKKPRKEYGSAKVSLVTLRASSQEEDDDDDGDDFEPDYEVECFSPEEVNKAPVFVPKGLRSPNPVPVQIEETMEELEIYENVADESCLPHELHVHAQPMVQEVNQLYSSQVVFVQEEQKPETGINDGSTEAAMTLLAMRDPVFQLNIGTQENPQEQTYKDELNTSDNLHNEHYESERIVPCTVSCSAASENELVPSDVMNRTTTEDCTNEPSQTRNCLQEDVYVPLPPPSENELGSLCSTAGLEDCSQEKSRASSDIPVSKRKKTPRLERFRFPKPKPNLNRGLGLKRNASQRSLGLSSEEELFNETKNDNKVSSSSTEKQKVQLEENLKSAELAQSSSEEKHGLMLGSAGPAVQKNNMDREHPVKETQEAALELVTSKTSPEAETCLPELPLSHNTNVDVPVSGLDGHQLAAADVAETEAMKQSSISVTSEVTSVGIKEYLATEEEPTFILTLVEIPADTEDCRGVPGSLEQTSAELLPAPVLFTSANINAVELTRDDSPGSITAIVEESAVSINSSTGREEGHISSSEELTDLSSVSLESLESCPVALEGSCDPHGKKRPASSTGEDLENSNKGIPPKLRCIPKQADEKNSEKLNISKKIISTSSLVPELYAKEEEQSQSSLNLGALQFGEAATSDEQMLRMLNVGKADTMEKQINITDTFKSVHSERDRSTEAFPKPPLSRSSQRSFGFLPLICKDNADEITIKPSKELHQGMDTVVSERVPKCAVSSREDNKEAQENISLPSAIPTSSTCEKESCSTVQVSSELSDSEGSSKEQEKEEEPTKISEYFFSDIFMEVDDSE